MTALLQAELLKLRTTRTFAAIVASAAALSLILVVLGAALGKQTKAHALFTNSAITYIIVILGAIAMTGEWRHRTITGSVLAAPNRVRLLAAKAISYSVAGIALAIIVTVPTIIVGELVLSGRGLATLGAGGIADVLWRNLAVAALLGPLGVCVGALVRNQIVTVIGLIIIAAAIEPAVFQAVPEVGRLLPLAGAPGGVLGGTHGDLSPGPALAVMVAWTLTIFAAAAWRLRSPRPRLTQTSRQTTNGPPPTAAGGPWSPGRSVGSAGKEGSPMSTSAPPVQIEFHADLHITRWRPLVQWLLAIPHLMIASALPSLRGP